MSELRPYLGGSDAAAIVGLSPWKTPIALWQEKVSALAGVAAEDTDSPVKARGRRWEPVAREMLVDALTEREMFMEVVGANRRYMDSDHAWMRAEIDAELVNLEDHEKVWNAELKTISPFAASREWGEEETDDIPDHYAAQAQWGMAVTGRQVCIVGALFGADRLRPYVVKRDDEIIAWLRDAAFTFWHENVLANKAPAPIQAKDLDLLYPKGLEAALMADPLLTHQVLRLRALDAEIKARNHEWEALEFAIKSRMAENSTILVGSEARPAITWKAEKRTILDQLRLKAEQPKLSKEYTRVSESRVFRLKSFSIEGVMP